jgi:uncharacterized protein
MPSKHIAFFLLLAGLALAGLKPSLSGARLNSTDLTVEPLIGDIVSLTVELALTKQEQAEGLMFRETLDDNAGMLFIFERPRIARFWMRNTLIPLDMVFIDPTGEVIGIETRLDTQSDAPSSSPAPVWAVLELKAGRAAELGMLQGSMVDITPFQN